MIKELSIVLAGDDRELGAVLNEVRKIKTVPIRCELVTLINLKSMLSRVHPQLIIYEMDGDTNLVGRIARAVADEFSHIHWAVTGKQSDVSTVVQFFRMGAIDFLAEPVQSEEMKRLIQKVISLESEREQIGDRQNRRLIGFFASKGGVGSSTLAVNTAVSLAAQNPPRRVLLLDLVLQHGNVTDLLDIPPKYTVSDLVENFDRLDTNLLENSMAKHASSGLYVLPCPRQPEDEESVTSAQISDIFGFLKSTFHYVVADLGHEFSKTAISYLDLSDFIFLVTTPDVPSLCSTRNSLAILNKLSYGQEKVKVILNRWRMKGEIDFSLIQKNFPMEVFCRIPDDVMASLSAANQGKPLSTVAKKAEVTRAIEKLASEIMNLSEKESSHVAQRKT